MHNAAPFPPSDRSGKDWEADASDDAFEPLSRTEAEALRARLPMLSPWRVIAVQTVAGIVCVVLAWVLTGRSATAVSALWGAATAVLPQALLARGVTRSVRGNAVTAAFGFLVWELAKIGLAVAMLAAAAKWVTPLSWPALLVSMVVCMKASWLALLGQRAPVIRRTNATRV